MNTLTLYSCETCGNLICMVRNSGVIPVCCGSPMTPVEANTVDASTELHVPVFARTERTVRISVGKTPHPMTETHHIDWIALLTDTGLYARRLHAGEAPLCEFSIGAGEKVTAVYAHCTLHGLWLKEAVFAE